MENLITHQSWPTLLFLKNKFLFSSLATNSINTYRYGVKQYVDFCSSLLIPPLPLSEPILENFVTSLCGRVGAKTMRVYLYGVQYWATLQGYATNIAEMTRLPYVIRGIRRWQGAAHTRAVRHPITLPLLHAILKYIDRNYVLNDRLMYRAAVLLAFFGMLRVSEFTAPSRTTFDPLLHLTNNDISFTDAFHIVCIQIKSSKTDPFRLGVTVRVGTTQDSLCPVSAMSQYLMQRPAVRGPLFIFRDATYLTKNNIKNLLKNSLPDVENISSHSFRRGGASYLAQAGLSHDVIQILGRWRSDAYRLYINLPDSFIRQVSGSAALQNKPNHFN